MGNFLVGFKSNENFSRQRISWLSLKKVYLKKMIIIIGIKVKNAGSAKTR